jgi:hypothetical protein
MTVAHMRYMRIIEGCGTIVNLLAAVASDPRTAPVNPKHALVVNKSHEWRDNTARCSGQPGG